MTTLSYQRDATHFSANISAVIGDGFATATSDREHRVLIGGENALPKTTTCDGKSIAVTDPGDTPGVWIDTQGVVVACGPHMLLAKAHTVSVTW